MKKKVQKQITEHIEKYGKLKTDKDLIKLICKLEGQKSEVNYSNVKEIVNRERDIMDYRLTDGTGAFISDYKRK